MFIKIFEKIWNASQNFLEFLILVFFKSIIILKKSVSKTLSLWHEAISFRRDVLSGYPFYRFSEIKVCLTSKGNILSIFGFYNNNLIKSLCWYISSFTESKFNSK